MKSIRKNWGYFVIISCIFGVLALLSALASLWITAAIAAVWAVIWWRFSTIRYQSSESELVITSGIFIKSLRTVNLGEILWKSRVSVGRAVITVLHTAAGSVILFAEI